MEFGDQQIRYLRYDPTTCADFVTGPGGSMAWPHLCLALAM